MTVKRGCEVGVLALHGYTKQSVTSEVYMDETKEYAALGGRRL